MHQVRLDARAGPARCRQWRDAARGLITLGIDPSAVAWTQEGQDGLAFDDEAGGACADAAEEISPKRSSSLRLPRELVDMLERIGCHNEPSRFALMYEALWRLVHGERHLLDLRHDPLVQSLQRMDTAVRREMHKTKAFVRFEPRRLPDGEPHWAAWFEPEFDALERVLPFFERRFANMNWSILTPRLSAQWDGERLTLGAGVDKPVRGHHADPLAAAWPIYYASIFNPARLKVQAMVKEMPRRYWPNLPEARVMPRLVADAVSRTQAMLDASTALKTAGPMPADIDAVADGEAGVQTVPVPVRGRVPVRLPPTAIVADPMLDPRRCDRCPHAAQATGAVLGEGPPTAQLMIVGEQPGDQEDLQGRVFVGPAGQVLDAALQGAGIDRRTVYLTNAVKHFNWQLRGKRRMHKTPGQQEIDACREHLLRELEQVRPKVVVALGATAVQSLTGGTGLQAKRGRPLTMPSGLVLLASWHPAYILRATGDAGRRARDELTAHLGLALALAGQTDEAAVMPA